MSSGSGISGVSSHLFTDNNDNNKGVGQEKSNAFGWWNISQHFSGPSLKKLGQIQALIDKITDFVGNFFNFLMPLIDLATNSVAAAGTFFTGISTVVIHVFKMRLGTFLSLPFQVYFTALDIYDLARGIFKKSYDKIVDISLGFVGRVSDLVISAGMCIEALDLFGKVPQPIATVIPNQLYAAGAILSVASVALNSKFLYEGVQFKKKIEHKESNSNSNLSNIINKAKKRDLRKHLGIDNEDIKVMRDCLDNINGLKDESKKETAQKEFHNALSRRVTYRNIEHGLKIASGIISLIATAILFFTPLTPLACGLYALSSAISISVFIMDKVVTRQTIKKIKELAAQNCS